MVASMTNEKEKALAMLGEVVETIRLNDLNETEAVAKARSCGASWTEIAQLYDVTRQAAHSRWANKERGGWNV